MARIEGIEIKPGDIINTHLGLQTAQEYQFVYDPKGKYEITFRGTGVPVRLQHQDKKGDHQHYSDVDLFS